LFSVCGSLGIQARLHPDLPGRLALTIFRPVFDFELEAPSAKPPAAAAAGVAAGGAAGAAPIWNAGGGGGAPPKVGAPNCIGAAAGVGAMEAGWEAPNVNVPPVPAAGAGGISAGMGGKLGAAGATAAPPKPPPIPPMDDGLGEAPMSTGEFIAIGDSLLVALPPTTGVVEAVAIGAGAAWEPKAKAPAGLSPGVGVAAAEVDVAPNLNPGLDDPFADGTGNAAGLVPEPNVKEAAPVGLAASAAGALAPNVKGVELAFASAAGAGVVEGAAGVKPPKAFFADGSESSDRSRFAELELASPPAVVAGADAPPN